MSGATISCAAGGLPLAVVASPLSVTVSGNTASNTTPTTTAVASGGVPPYAYAWAITLPSGPRPITATAPTSATTAFTASLMGSGSTNFCNPVVTVTDSSSNTVNNAASPVYAEVDRV